MKIINFFMNKITNLNSKIKLLMLTGMKLSFILLLLAVLVLSIYITTNNIPKLFYIGLSLLHSSLMFGCSFFVFGCGFDTIKNQLEH